jgi:uncharacterized RDD family membrane protein YckC
MLLYQRNAYMDNYFVKDDKGEKGPFTFDELTDGRLEPNDLVRTPLTNWTKASDMPELIEYFRYEGYYFPTLDNLAGFGIRLLAFLIDYFIVTALLRIELGVFADYLPVDKVSKFAFGHTISPADVPDLLIIQGLVAATFFIYNLVCYLTPLSATLGQYACRLVVVNEDGEKLSFGKALVRSIGKLISTLFFGVGFWMVLFTEYKQGLHDKLAKTYVLRKDVF